MRTHSFRLAFLGILVLASDRAVALAAEGPPAGRDSAFTVQFRVTETGAPLSGSLDVRASLFGSAAGTDQVGTTLQLNEVQAAQGFASVRLDFGEVFDQRRFLELALRSPSDATNTGSFTVLSPRIELTPSPEALSAHDAAALAAPAVITADDAGLATLTVENTAAGGTGMQVIGHLKVGEPAASESAGGRSTRGVQNAFEVDGVTGNVLSLGSVQANTLGIAADGLIQGSLEVGSKLDAFGNATVYLDLEVGDDLTVADEATIGGGLDVASGTLVVNPFSNEVRTSMDLFVGRDAHVTGSYFDSANSRGTADQFLSSTGTGTQWRDLIVDTLDMKSFAITNIGSSGSSFGNNGDLTVNSDATIKGQFTAEQGATLGDSDTDATLVKGTLVLADGTGTVNASIDGTTGDMDLGSGAFTVNPLTKSLRFGDPASPVLTASDLIFSFVAVNGDFRVNAPSQSAFLVDAGTGDAFVRGKLEVDGAYIDSADSPGDSTKVLGSTGTGTKWVPALVPDDAGNVLIAGTATVQSGVSVGGAQPLQGANRALQLPFFVLGVPGETPWFYAGPTFTGIKVQSLVRFAVEGIGQVGSPTLLSLPDNAGGAGYTEFHRPVAVLSSPLAAQKAGGSLLTMASYPDRPAGPGYTEFGRPIYVDDQLFDALDRAGEVGQVLSSTAAGVKWIDCDCTGTGGSAIIAAEAADFNNPDPSRSAVSAINTTPNSSQPTVKVESTFDPSVPGVPEELPYGEPFSVEVKEAIVFTSAARVEQVEMGDVELPAAVRARNQVGGSAGHFSQNAPASGTPVPSVPAFKIEANMPSNTEPSLSVRNKGYGAVGHFVRALAFSPMPPPVERPVVLIEREGFGIDGSPTLQVVGGSTAVDIQGGLTSLNIVHGGGTGMALNVEVPPGGRIGDMHCNIAAPGLIVKNDGGTGVQVLGPSPTALALDVNGLTLTNLLAAGNAQIGNVFINAPTAECIAEGGRLVVNGGITVCGAGSVIAPSIVQTDVSGPDYVFEPDYPLMPLSDLREFLAREKHLPNVPSAARVEEDEGLNLGEFQMRLLEKIEELTLYTLQQEDRLGQLQAENEQLRARMDRLESMLTGRVRSAAEVEP